MAVTSQDQIAALPPDALQLPPLPYAGGKNYMIPLSGITDRNLGTSDTTALSCLNFSFISDNHALLPNDVEIGYVYVANIYWTRKYTIQYSYDIDSRGGIVKPPKSPTIFIIINSHRYPPILFFYFFFWPKITKITTHVHSGHGPVLLRQTNPLKAIMETIEKTQIITKQ